MNQIVTLALSEIVNFEGTLADEDEDETPPFFVCSSPVFSSILPALTTLTGGKPALTGHTFTNLKLPCAN
jgi:hypothetical protein